MRTVARAVLPALLLTPLLWTSSAWAITYSYVGDTFRSNIAEPLTGVYTLSDRISGWLTVYDAFVPTQARHYGAPSYHVTAGVLSYSFTDGHQTLTQDNSTADFWLAIDPNLNWWVGISTPMDAAGIISFLESDREDHAWIGTSNDARNTNGFYTDGSHPGVWTVPESATLILLAAGLLVVGGGLRRRRRTMTPWLMPGLQRTGLVKVAKVRRD